MAGMDLEAQFMGKPGASADAIEFGGCPVRMPLGQRLAPRSGVNFDDGGAQGGGGFNLRSLGGDEQRYANAGRTEFLNQRIERVVLAGGIEAALGGALFTPLWDDAGGMRPNPDGNVHHLAGRGHFKIKRPVDARFETL